MSNIKNATKRNDIQITRTPRAFSVVFPYKPCPGAISGFHSIGMVWQKQRTGEVRWSIPADKLEQALDFIGFWYTNNPIPGTPPYGVLPPPSIEDELASILAEPENVYELAQLAMADRQTDRALNYLYR